MNHQRILNSSKSSMLVDIQLQNMNGYLFQRIILKKKIFNLFIKMFVL